MWGHRPRSSNGKTCIYCQVGPKGTQKRGDGGKISAAHKQKNPPKPLVSVEYEEKKSLRPWGHAPGRKAVFLAKTSARNAKTNELREKEGRVAVTCRVSPNGAIGGRKKSRSGRKSFGQSRERGRARGVCISAVPA